MSHENALIAELNWRGLLFQQTEGLSELLASGPLAAYCGFDPTAPSLHVGNLVPVMGLLHLQRAGHRPVALVGGGTGMIGDPSGKTVERQLNTADVVEANTAAIREQLARFLDFSGSNAAVMDNNASWLMELRAVDFMRDIGKHFTLNYMLAKDSVNSRIQSGISYTEFSYMLLQAYDYLELNRRHGVSLQIGGSDQWGNITAGIELVRRVAGAHVGGLTLPLVTNSAGTKFGKTESGSVWLDANRTSPYKFFQFWRNVDDADAGRYLRYFTMLSHDEILALEAEAVAAPQARAAQARLASEVTEAVHGRGAAAVAADISSLLFSGGDPRALSEQAFAALANEIPFLEVVASGDEVADVLTVMHEGKLAASRGAARRLVEQGGVYINGERCGAERRHLTASDFLAGGHVLLRKGARDYLLVRATPL